MSAPALTPYTFPEPSTVATDTLLLLHVPPVVASLRVLTAPAQTDAVPVMALLDGNGLTVTT